MAEITEIVRHIATFEDYRNRNQVLQFEEDISQAQALLARFPDPDFERFGQHIVDNLANLYHDMKRNQVGLNAKTRPEQKSAIKKLASLLPHFIDLMDHEQKWL